MRRRVISPIYFFIVTAMLNGSSASAAAAQSSPVELTSASSPQIPSALLPLGQPATREQLPDAPGESGVDSQVLDLRSDGSIYGTVIDPSGNVIPGAGITLEDERTKAAQSRTTDSNGFFKFTDLSGGTFRVIVRCKGFADWVGPEVILSPGMYYELPDVKLQIASANADVRVQFTAHELAEQQIKDEEQQRILGVVPNFYTSYVWRAVPLTSGQKFRLAWRSLIDPVTILLNGATAGIEQWQNYFSGYGQGAEGYGKRFAATSADSFISTMVGGAILPSVLHQDPRYYYKGTGSISSRALYAVSTVLICRGDNGHWEPNYSNVLGNLASAEISNLYYPASDRNSAAVTLDNALIGTAEGAVGALLQEFVLKKFSRGIKASAENQP